MAKVACELVIFAKKYNFSSLSRTCESKVRAFTNCLRVLTSAKLERGISVETAADIMKLTYNDSFTGSVETLRPVASRYE